MLALSNGIRVILDHVAWYSLRHDEVKNRWLLQFGYGGTDNKTFIAYSSETEARGALADVDRAMEAWLK